MRLVGKRMHTWSHWFGRKRQPLVDAMIADITSFDDMETVAGPAMVAVWFDFAGSPHKRARLY